MMWPTLLLVMAPAQLADQEAEQEVSENVADETPTIVVTGRELKERTWRGSLVSMLKPDTRCVTTTTLGIQAFDDLACETMLACYKSRQVGHIARINRLIKPKEIVAEVNVLNKELNSCVGQSLTAELIDNLADKRVESSLPMKPDPASPYNQIFVMKQNLFDLLKWKWAAKRNKDTDEWEIKYCRIQKSTGDSDLDAIACDVISQCLVFLPKVDKPMKDVYIIERIDFQDCQIEKRMELIQQLYKTRNPESIVRAARRSMQA